MILANLVFCMGAGSCMNIPDPITVNLEEKYVLVEGAVVYFTVRTYELATNTLTITVDSDTIFRNSFETFN